MMICASIAVVSGSMHVTVVRVCGCATVGRTYSDTMNGLDASECGAIGVKRVHGTDGATSAPPAERLSA